MIGREFELGVLHRVSRLSVRRLADALSEAVRAGSSPRMSVPGRYAFTHDLVRETLYQDMPAARRLALHRTVGLVLQALFDDLEPHLAELAHHFTQSAPLGDAAPAVEFSIRAGDRAAGCWRTRTRPGTTRGRCGCCRCSSMPMVSGAARSCSGSAMSCGGQGTKAGAPEL